MNKQSRKKAVSKLQFFFLVALFLAGSAFILLQLPLLNKNRFFLASATNSSQQADTEKALPEFPPLSASIKLFACGDILLSRTPGKRAGENGYQYLFSRVKKAVSEADVAFANLESPASYLGEPYPGKPENVTFRSDPASLFGLKWAGFDVVSLANNHMNDYGPRALRETLDYLDLLEIARCGSGSSAGEARSPAIVVKNGVKLAFLAYAEPIWSVIEADDILNPRILTRIEKRLHGISPVAQVVADPDNPGTGPEGVALARLESIVEDIRSVRGVYKPDYILVSVHWGEEHQHYPQKWQKILGRAIIDAGATAVLGHHPHVLQGIELYHGGAILYSMGNFVFDMRAEATYESAFFELLLAGGMLESLRITPVVIERGSYIPGAARGDRAARILADIKNWSGVSGQSMQISTDFATMGSKLKK